MFGRRSRARSFFSGNHVRLAKKVVRALRRDARYRDDGRNKSEIDGL